MQLACLLARVQWLRADFFLAFWPTKDVSECGRKSPLPRTFGNNLARMRFVEVLATPLSFENFSKIKNGTKVILQIGKAYKYKLSKNDLKMIDDFVSQRIPVNP